MNAVELAKAVVLRESECRASHRQRRTSVQRVAGLGKGQIRVLRPLKACHCGEKSYGRTCFEDVVRCNNCGTMYFIDFVDSPVAEYGRETENV